MGVGVQEILIIAVILVLLFGAPILTFLLGYTLGRKQGGAKPPADTEPRVGPPASKETPDE